jgi:Uma2 family endonuclease
MVMVPESIVRRRLTLEDYKALPNDADYEIIDGVLYVAPRARPRHQIFANRMSTELTVHAERPDIGFVVPDADLIIDDKNTYISPDIMYFTADRFRLVDATKMISVMPDLVVEILSPSNELYDLVTKRALYARLRVPHYWILDSGRKAVTEHVLEAGDYRERTIVAPDLFVPELFPNLSIDLERLFTLM